jgi:hypothetical protein
LLALARRFFRRRAIRSKVVRALGTGVGVYEASFAWPEEDGSEAALAIVAWCREMLSRTDRPYGLDQVTLTLALESPDGARTASETLQVLRPADFYEDDRALRGLESALGRWTGLPNSTPHRVHAVLFSWGDLARELLPAG